MKRKKSARITLPSALARDRRHDRPRLSSLVLALATIGAAVDAPAQTDQEAAGRDRVGPAIEEVVVTARRRTERLQDVPVTANVFDERVLDRYAVNNVQSISDMTPHFIANSGGASSGTQLFVRGIGSTGNVGFDQAVGLVIDGVFYSRGRWIKQGFLDMERVEVLKGPQALYFGKNTPAGVVSIKTADPGESFEAYLRTEYEMEADEWVAEAAVSGPVTETFGARLALRATAMDGYMDNEARPRTGVDPLGFTIPGAADDRTPNEEEYSGRLTLVWEPTPRLTSNLKLSYTDFEDAGTASKFQLAACQGPNNTPQPVFGVPSDDDCTLDDTLRKADLIPEIAAAGPSALKDGEPYTEYESWAVALNVDYELDDYILTSVTGINDYRIAYNDNFDYTTAGQIFALEIVDNRAISQELRLLSEYAGPLNFLVGLYYQDTDFNYRNSSRVAPVPADPVTGRYYSWDRPQTQEGESFSAFGEILWDVTPQLELAVGARYTDEKKDSSSRNAYIHSFLAGVFTTEAFSDKFEDEDVSPQATLTWRPKENLSFFGAYKTGFKAGGFSHQAVLLTGTTLDELVYDSESVEGFEAGFKGRLFADALRLNASAYWYDFEDLQVNSFNSDTTSFTVKNAAEVRSRGVEADAELLLTDALTLRATLAYNKSRYEEFLAPCYAGQTQEAGCDEVINPATGVATSQDLEGEAPLLAPDWNGSLGFTYDAEVARGWRFSVSADARYSDEYSTSLQNRPALFQDDYTTLDAAIRLVDPSERLELALIGRNLTDEEIITSGGDRPGTGGPPGLPAGDPAAGVEADGAFLLQRLREIRLQATYRFR